jgi:hypothetical protein
MQSRRGDRTLSIAIATLHATTIASQNVRQFWQFFLNDQVLPE